MRKVRFSALTFCTVLASQSLPAQAGPDENTSRLMNESVSLLDFGILRLQLLLDNTKSISRVGVDYSWDEDTVIISGVSFQSDLTREGVEQVCTDWFLAIRHAAGVNTNTGKPFFGLTTIFSDMFSHYGYDKTVSGKATSEVASELDKKFSLVFTWFSGSSTLGEVSSIACTGRLLDTGFSTKIETVKAGD